MKQMNVKCWHCFAILHLVKWKVISFILDKPKGRILKKNNQRYQCQMALDLGEAMETFWTTEGFQEHTNIRHSEKFGRNNNLQWLTVSLNQEKEFSLLRNWKGGDIDWGEVSHKNWQPLLQKWRGACLHKKKPVLNWAGPQGYGNWRICLHQTY